MKNVKIITIILAIILVTLVAFGGVYIKTQNRMENKVKDYELGRELKGGRVVQLKVVATSNDNEGDVVGDHKNEGTDDVKSENLTVENYEIVKKTIETRLKSFGAQDYTISLNDKNGTIIVELPENVDTDIYAYLLTVPVEVQITEKDTNTELLNDSMVKKALYTYTADAEGSYQVLLALHLTEEGQAKVEEIKNEYAILAEEVKKIEEEADKKEETTDGETITEENLTETTENKKIVKLTIAGNEYDINQIEKNQIIVAIGGKTTNTASVNNNIASAAELATLISSGKYPIKYEISDNRFVHSNIAKEQIIYFVIAVAIVMLIIFAIFIIKYKARGLLASVSFIGFIAVLSLLLRYTNVNISIEGIGAIILTIIINFIINQNILNKGKEVNYKELALKLVPIVIIALVFSFTKWSNLSSFGMVIFWGLALIAVYNTLVTKTLLKLKESK